MVQTAGAKPGCTQAACLHAWDIWQAHPSVPTPLQVIPQPKTASLQLFLYARMCGGSPLHSTPHQSWLLCHHQSTHCTCHSHSAQCHRAAWPPQAASPRDRQADEYGQLHASGLHSAGRIILNLWRLLRSELKLPIYTFEACVAALLQLRTPHLPPWQLAAWFDQPPPGGGLLSVPGPGLRDCSLSRLVYPGCV